LKTRTIKQFFVFLIIVSTIFTTVNFSYESNAIDPFFTLVAKVHGGSYVAEHFDLVKQKLSIIGINLDICVLDWPTYIAEIYVFRDFDLVSLSFAGGDFDLDFTNIYAENGSLNAFGYHTNMDYNKALGTGLNEWYMRQSNLIMPPDSPARIQHYWDWQQYLMDRILPCLPLFTAKSYEVQWSNLDGYNFSEGIIQSWGKMSFIGNHTGQLDNTELVTTDTSWSNLNPLFEDYLADGTISLAIMDPLVWIDNDKSIWPHLAESYTMVNDTQVRIITREGIKWQDPGGYAEEYFDARDVYFTLYACKTLSDRQDDFEWIEDMKILDARTLDIFIDGNKSTVKNELYAPFLNSLSVKMLPEHYLNVTQLADGITPNTNHSNWNSFATNAFGTGLFELGSFTEEVETELTIFEDCWKLNADVNKDNMDFKNRFGDFTGGLDTWRIRIIYDPKIALNEFEAGKVDLEDTGSFKEKREEYRLNPEFKVQERLTSYCNFIGFNMRPTRAQIGNPDPIEGGTMTVGLAIRKAICYAINRTEINEVMNNGERAISNYPIYQTLGIWCNPKIIKYKFNSSLASEYLALAGFKESVPTDFVGYSDFSFVVGVFVLSIVILYIRKRKPKLER